MKKILTIITAVALAVLLVAPAQAKPAKPVVVVAPLTGSVSLVGRDDYGGSLYTEFASDAAASPLDSAVVRSTASGGLGLACYYGTYAYVPYAIWHQDGTHTSYTAQVGCQGSTATLSVGPVRAGDRVRVTLTWAWSGAGQINTTTTATYGSVTKTAALPTFSYDGVPNPIPD